MVDIQKLKERAREVAKRNAVQSSPSFRVKTVITPDGVLLGFINASRNVASLTLLFDYFLSYMAAGGTFPSSDAESEFIKFLQSENIPIDVDGEGGKEMPVVFASHRGGQLKWLLEQVAGETINEDAVGVLAERLARAYLSS